MSLTPKQSRFVAEYLVDLNATQAAIRAGYSTNRADAMGFYTYFLIDPASQEIFYVGKGKGKRMFAHAKKAALGVVDNAEKHKRIAQIHAAGHKVNEVVFSEHENESDAFEVERGLIHALREHGLTNISGGAVSNAELTREQAKVSLSRMKTFEQWIATASATQLKRAAMIRGSAKACYDDIRDGFMDLAYPA